MTAQETQGDPSIEHLCLLGSVSRADFYRFGEVHAPKRTEADLRDKIQTIAMTDMIGTIDAPGNVKGAVSVRTLRRINSQAAAQHII